MPRKNETFVSACNSSNMNQTQCSMEPSDIDIRNTRGAVVLEFGTDWCGHCQAAQPAIASALQAHPDVEHLRIEDGKGRPLGRSFAVKLWPTLIFLKDGREIVRLVRPRNGDEVAAALAKIDSEARTQDRSPART
jgi:thioredoxin 1